MKCKKILIIFLSLFLVLFYCPFIVKAITNDDVVYDDQGKYGWISNVVKNEEVAKDTTFIYDAGTSIRNGTEVKQDLYMLLQNSNANEGIKVVSWGGYNQNHSISNALPRMSLSTLAEDYEKNHPGWKVIGGINADQYCWGYGGDPLRGYDILENRPYYTMKADGENWFSHHFMGNNCGNLVGFLNDGSKQLVFDTAATAVDPTFMLNVYDTNDNLIKKFTINDLNPKNKVDGEYIYVYALTDTGNTNINLSKDKESKSVSISSTNDLYIVNQADKIWLSNSVDYDYFKNASNSNSVARNSFFGKGLINEVAKETTLTATQFAIETTNNELLEILKNNECYVVAQYEIGGQYLDCESAIGFHTIQRLNGKDQNVDNSYNTRGYPRSVVGVTSDGRVALITGNGTAKSGFYAQEINAICKKYDITTAFQMDGGGSVTMILQNDSGSFDVINTPSDGSERSIYNGLFFVVRDIDSDINVINVSQNSLSLNVNISDYGVFKNITNTYVKLSGKSDTGKEIVAIEEVVNNKVEFKNLESNVNYTYNILLKTNDNDDYLLTYTSGIVKTGKKPLVLKFIEMDIKNDKLVIKIMIDDPDESLARKFRISFNDNEINEYISPNTEIYIDSSNIDPLGNITIIYDYKLFDDQSSNRVTVDNVDIICTPTVYFESMLVNANYCFESCFNVE